MSAISINSFTVGGIDAIQVNEVQSNLMAVITGKRYHVVYTDRSVFLPAEWVKAHKEYDMTNSWIYSTDYLTDADRVAAWHYAGKADFFAQNGIDNPVRIIDSETQSYVDITDDAVLFAHEEAKRYNLEEARVYAEMGMI